MASTRNIKQNKKIVAIFIAIIVFVASFSIEALAYTDNSNNGIGFDFQPLTVTTSPTFDDSLYIGDLSNTKYYVSSKNNDDIYCFAIPNSSEYNVVFVSKQNSPYSIVNYSFDNKNGALATTSSFTINTSTYYSQYGYYIRSGTRIDSNLNVPLFDNIIDGISAVNDWIDNPPSPDVLHELNFTLKAGTIAFIDISGDDFNSALLATTTPTSHSSPFSSNQAIGYSNTLPSGSFSLPYPGTSPISWNGQGGKTLFGGYREWARSMSVNDSNGKYLVIANPHYPQDTPENQATNGVISVHIDQAVTYKVYSLTGDWDNGTIVNNSNGDSWSGDFDDTTNTWGTVNDQTGLPGTPTSGNAGGTIKDVKDWLEDIANTIGGFFTGAIGAITNLVSAGSSFFQVLLGLYSWLPISVLSVLSSALIIVITIGVIKVFL